MQMCQQAEHIWDLPRLFADLSAAKQKRLTPCERQYACGLLVGYGPQEIAAILNKDKGGVRVALLPLYRYAEALLGSADKTVNSKNFAQRLSPYRRASHPISVVSAARIHLLLINYSNDVTLEQSIVVHKDYSVKSATLASLSIADWSAIVGTCPTIDAVVLILPQTAVISELVTEEIRWLRQQLSGQTAPLPRFIGVRLGDYAVDLLNYDLRGLIDAIAPQAWQSATDTPAVLENLHQILTLEQDELASQWPIQPSANVLPNTADVSIEVSKQPPLPIAAPELPGGQMDLTSAFYVERPPVEMRCYEMLDQPGSLIRIKAPRQMGKTSLLARILHQAAEREHRAVSLSFQIADASVFSDLKQFLKWFCACLSRKLQLPNRVNEVWDDILGAKMNCSTYFEDCLLPEIGGTLTLGLDELDCVFAYSDVVKDFLGLLRTWNEDAKTGGIWRKLQLVLVHSTEVYIPLDISQSPFNVGLPIELKDFNVEQILDLAYRHHLAWRDTEAQRLMAMIGGHPFLSRLSLYHLARRDITLDELQKGSATEAGLYGDHLRRQLWTLQQYPDLADAMRAVVASQSPVRLELVQAFKLSGMGLVLLDNNEVYPRYELYRQYFSDRLS